MKISNIKSVLTVVIVLVVIVVFPSCSKHEVVSPQNKIEEANNSFSRRGLDEEYVLQGGPKKKNGGTIQNGKVKIVEATTGIEVIEIQLDDNDKFSISLEGGEYILRFYENDKFIGKSGTLELKDDLEVYIEV